jgi:hypothetical protein
MAGRMIVAPLLGDAAGGRAEPREGGFQDPIFCRAGRLGGNHFVGRHDIAVSVAVTVQLDRGREQHH